MNHKHKPWSEVSKSVDRSSEGYQRELARLTVENDALDLGAITDEWLLMCPPCDGGLPMGCTHPDEDYRPVMLALVREIERLRTRVTPPALSASDVEAGAKALFEHFHRSRRYGGDYQWPAPEQHLPWWRDAARAVLAAVPATETAIERAYDNGREDHRAHDCCQTRPIPPADGGTQ